MKTRSPQQVASLFRPGNRAGVATRFKPGQSGNPRGRPPKVSTSLRWMREARLKPGHLHQILGRADFRRTEKTAARLLLVAHYLHHEFPPAAPEETRRVYRGWHRAQRTHLEHVLIDRNEPIERREAARLRLLLWI